MAAATRQACAPPRLHNLEPYGTEACAVVPAAAVVAGNSGDAGSSGELEARTTGSAARSPPGAAARTARTLPAADSECYTHQHTAGTVFDDHYLCNLAANRSPGQHRGPVRPPFAIASDSWLSRLHNSSW